MEELSREEINRFLDEKIYGRMGCHHEGVTYIVPLIYAREDDALYIIATEGMKTRFARANPRVCFEVDEHDPATGSWRGVIVQGTYEELGPEQKALAFAAFGRRFPPRKAGKESSHASAKPTLALRIRIEEATGRVVKREGPVG